MRPPRRPCRSLRYNKLHKVRTSPDGIWLFYLPASGGFPSGISERQMARILIIDDEDELRSMLAQVGHEVTFCKKHNTRTEAPHSPSTPIGTLTALMPISATA